MAGQRWTKRDDNFIVNSYSKLPLSEVASRLKRSPASVKSRALKISKDLQKWASLEPTKPMRSIPGVNTGFNGGFQEDLGVSTRSGWETIVLRWLTRKGITWEYETKLYEFPGIKQRFTRSYLPDIYLPYEDLLLEVKGHMRDKDVTKLKRMARYFPEDFAKLRGIPGSPGSKAARCFKELGIPIYAYYNDIEKEYLKG